MQRQSISWSDNSNIVIIKAQHRQIMATITHVILKFGPVIKILILEDIKFLTVIAFSNIIFFL